MPASSTISPFPRLPDFHDGDTDAELVTTFHRALLPAVETSNAAIRCETRYRPGERRLSLGGDFLDVVGTPHGELAFVIGDVAGHGPFAAAVALAMRASWRTVALGETDLTVWLTRMEQVLGSFHSSDELFVTVCVGIISSDCMTGAIASAGHPPPIVLTDLPRAVAIEPSPPLGVAPGADHVVSHVVLGPHWGLLAYTDGLIEGRRSPGSSDRYGVESLTDWLAADVTSRLHGDRLDQLIVDVEAANGGPADDDVALLLLSSRSG